MKRDGALESLWQNEMPDYVAQPYQLNNNDTFDAVIVGGGITGITTALFLQQAGKKCLLAEAHSLGFGTTGGTTAHINTLLDKSYDLIIRDFGEKDAQLIAEGCRQAVDLIKTNVLRYSIDCDYSEHNAILFAQDEKQEKQLKDLMEGTHKAGISIEYTASNQLPVPFTKAAMVGGQASFHPAKYIYGIAKAFEAAGGIIMQQCRVVDVKEDLPLTIKTSLGEVRALDIIYATHIPPGVNLLHFRCAPYRSYAMAVTLNDDNYPTELVYDMYDPYHYYRTQVVNGKKYLVFGGEDHKTAHEENTSMCFTRLEAYGRKYFDIGEVAFRWSSQYFEPADGLPYIGHLPGHEEHFYVATGYSGNGIPLGTLSAILLCDMLTGSDNPLHEVLDPNRIKPVAGFVNFVKEAADVVGILTKSISPGKKIDSIVELAPGEARVVQHEGESIALYKDENGLLHAVNPACTHIKCSVAWNAAEQSWDCPCHGSRFSADGEMLTGPARKNLSPITMGMDDGEK
jgi:glycine/D-amino acid oxidase-like deaminating enzyme/nitrite reductase/ring-hydroxylating ferredoxin subunit